MEKPYFFAEINSETSNIRIEWGFDNNDIEKKIRAFLIIEFGPQQNINNFIEIPPGVFINSVDKFRRLLNSDSSIKKVFRNSDSVKRMLNNIPRYENSIKNPEIVSRENIKNKLRENNFQLELYENEPDQIRNVQFLLQFPSANFSIPGAGKTIEALAYYTYKRKSINSKVLVICPLNVFTTWEEETKLCFGDDFKTYELRSDANEFKKQFQKNGSFYVTTYQSIFNEDKRGIICNELMNKDNDYFVFMDESHKMKGQRTGKQINDYISPFVKNKIIMTGTPNPQHYKDLITQFNHLYPMEQKSSNEDLRPQFNRIFCRTGEGDLASKLPKLNEEIIQIPMNEGLSELYQSMKSAAIREINFPGKIDQARLSRFKSIIIKMIKLCSNPLLEIEYIKNFLDDEILAKKVEDEGNGYKFDRLINDAIDLCEKGEKLVIWSGFPDGINKLMENIPRHLSPVMLHGRMDFGDNSTKGTRKHSIHNFKYNDECRVFIANPLAAAEGISLHKVCRNAFYLDRDFNLASYLQSKRRIYRLGSDKDKPVNIKIYQYITGNNQISSIDEIVNDRLGEKNDIMEIFLRDTGNVFEESPYPLIEDVDETKSNDQDSHLLSVDDDDLKILSNI